MIKAFAALIAASTIFTNATSTASKGVILMQYIVKMISIIIIPIVYIQFLIDYTKMIFFSRKKILLKLDNSIFWKSWTSMH